MAANSGRTLNTFYISLKEKLIIKNFGPIKDVELELGKFNILIGEQATGKSTVAKVLAVCRYFSYIMPNSYWENDFGQGLQSWGIRSFFDYEKSFISYSCELYSLEIYGDVEMFVQLHEDGNQSPSPGIKVKLSSNSEIFTKLLDALKLLQPDSSEEDFFFRSVPTSFFQNEVARVLDNPFYLPVERGLQSIFSLGKSSIQNIDDSLFNQFAKLDHIARSFKSDTSIEPLSITYKNENGQGFIKSEKHGFIPLSNAASGYQSTIPIVLVLKNYNRIKRKGKTFIIEEPELNLFPNAQQKLMEYLVEQVNSYSNTFLITTHSPYVLTSLNNMMYAWQVGQEKREKVTEIVAEKYWSKPNEVKAYQLLPDGTCESLTAEDGLLMTEKIDVVSGKINEAYDKILNIQYSNDRPQELSELQTSFG